MKPNWMWCIQKKNDKLRTLTVVADIKVIGFCTRKGLVEFTDGSPGLEPGDRIVKVEFRLPKVPKPKKAKVKKVHVAKKATATQIRKTLGIKT